MKKAALALLVVLLIAGAYLYGRFRQAKEAALPDEVQELSDSGIRQGLLSADLKERLDALEQLDKLPEAERKKALLKALDTPYSPTRLTAVAALGGKFPSDAEAIEALLAIAKNDPDADIRAGAFRALSGSGDPRVLDLSVEVLNTADAGIAARLAAATTLDALTGRETAAAIADPLRSAEDAADDLGMEWDDWLGENRDRLTWNAEKGRFE